MDDVNLQPNYKVYSAKPLQSISSKNILQLVFDNVKLKLYSIFLNHSSRNKQTMSTNHRVNPSEKLGLWAKIPEVVKKLLPEEEQEKNKRPRIGLALSSGGCKGLSHIGVLEILVENNIPIDVISGSSMGSYIAALYACGVSIPEMKRLAEEIGTGKTFSKLADPANPLKGFLYGEKAKEHLEETIGKRTFESLDIDLQIIAADLDTYERVVFRKGLISEAVHASCAIPGVVVPPTYHGRRLTDGGVVDPVPICSLNKFNQVDHIIAVSTVRRLQDIDSHNEALNLAKAESEAAKESPGFLKSTLGAINLGINPSADGNIVDTLKRSLKAAQIRLAHESCKRASISLHPAAKFVCNWHDYKYYEEFIEFGREAALAALPEIKKLTNPIHHDNSKEISMVGKSIT